MFVCLFVLYRNPNHWRYWDEIWHGGGPCGGKVLPPSGPGCIKGVQGASGASRVHFCKNFKKQKLQDTPDLVGAGHLLGHQIWIWKDLSPMSFWSHCHSLWRGVDKIKVVVFVTNSYLMRLDTLYPDLRVWGGPKGGQVGICSPSCAFGGTLYQTKVEGHTQLSGGRSPFWTPNPDLEGPGPSVLLEPWSFTFKESL